MGAVIGPTNRKLGMTAEEAEEVKELLRRRETCSFEEWHAIAFNKELGRLPEQQSDVARSERDEAIRQAEKPKQ